MKKSVMLLGGGARPTEFKTNEYWGLNSHLHLTLPKVTRMFDLHHYKILKRDGWDFEREILFAQQNPKCPLYVLERWPEPIKNQIIFPGKKLSTEYTFGDYHCGSFDWMVAFAIHEKFKKIILNGIGLSLVDGGEPLSARACLEFWCGVATGKGIEIGAINCDLFTWQHIVKSYEIYGYDDVTLLEDRTRK